MTAAAAAAAATATATTLAGSYQPMFDAVLKLELDSLEALPSEDLTPILPALVKIILNPAYVRRPKLLAILYPIRRVNDIIQLFQAPCLDLCDHTKPPPLTQFESANAIDKLMIVTAEYLRIQEIVRQMSLSHTLNSKLITSSLFDNPTYEDDIGFCLSVLLMKPTSMSVINILDMAEALLHVKLGINFIMRLILNAPEACLEVSFALMNNGERLDEGASLDEVSELRAKTLRLLTTINPDITFTVRTATLQMFKMPSLTVMITLDHMTRALERYDNLITQREDKPDVEDDSNISLELSEAYSELEDIFDCAIAFITGVLLSSDDGTRQWFAQYTKTAQLKRIDQNFFSILTQFRSQLIVYINRLFSSMLKVESNSPFDETSNDASTRSNNSEPSYRHTKQQIIRAIATLRLYCALRGVGYLKINPDESEILLKLVTCKLPPDSTSAIFATTGICTLLACSALVNSQRDEKRAAEWLKWLIRDSKYSDNQDSSQGTCSMSELLLLIAVHFQNNQHNQIAELVCTTLNMKLQIKASISKCKSMFVQEVFSDQAIAEHAVKVPVAKNLNNDIKEFLPAWLNFDNYDMHDLHITHHVTTQKLRHEIAQATSTSSSPIKGMHSSKSPSLMRQLTDGIKDLERNPLGLAKTLNRITNLSKDEVWPFVTPFIDQWTCIIQYSMKALPESERLIKAASKLWWKLDTIFPRKLWVMTLNSLRKFPNSNGNGTSTLEYSWDELTVDPLIVLRCDILVFRCVEALKIVLHILEAFLASSRGFLQGKVSDAQSSIMGGQASMKHLEELTTTLILAQTSAAIQILLEFCLPTPEEQEILDRRERSYSKLNQNDKFLLSRFDASVDCICEHLHQVFIADTNLAKLIHFQTYPKDLLATTSNKIPSMHICLDFIPELLSQPDLEKQIFVIELTSHLCEKYAITKSLNVAKLCFNVAYTLLQLLPSERRALFFIPVLPALLRLSNVYPILREDAEIILGQLNQITHAHLASTSSRLGLGHARPCLGLDKMNWRDMNAMMSQVNLDEGLYLCIQKCMLEFDGAKT